MVEKSSQRDIPIIHPCNQRLFSEPGKRIPLSFHVVANFSVCLQFRCANLIGDGARNCIIRTTQTKKTPPLLKKSIYSGCTTEVEMGKGKKPSSVAFSLPVKCSLATSTGRMSSPQNSDGAYVSTVHARAGQ